MQLSLFYTPVTVFYWKNNMQKLKMGTSTRRLRDPVGGRPRDQMMGHSGDVSGTSVIHVFLNSTQKHIKLTLTGYSRLYSEFSEQYRNLNNKN